MNILNTLMDHISSMKPRLESEKRNKPTYAPTVCIVDGALVLSLPNADMPVVWKMDIANVKSSALAVEAASNNSFTLTLKNMKGENYDVANYADREDALHILMLVTKALQSAEGKMVRHSDMIASTAAPQKLALSGVDGKKWLYAGFAIVGVLFLYAYMAKNVTQVASYDTNQASMTAPASGTEETGVPQSADDMLKGF